VNSRQLRLGRAHEEVRGGGCDEQAGRLLRDLFERRGQADYSTDPVPPAEGDRAIADAETVVAAIEPWLEHQR
jgi:hypothetical protein